MSGSSPRMSEVTSIAVVGAGPGGLTLANALAQQGFDVTVYEQARAFERVGAGIQLGANATAALAGIGVVDDLVAAGMTPSLRLTYEGDTGDVVGEAKIGAAAYYSPYVQIHRADLHEVLVSKLDGVDIQHGTCLRSLEQDERGVVLTFEDGTSAEAELVVGADGIHSVVRAQLFGERPLQFSGWASHRGMLSAKAVEDLELDVVAAKWMGPDRHLIHYFVSPEELTFIAVLPQELASTESWSRRSDKAEVLEALDGFHPQVLELVSRCDQINKWAIYDRDAMPVWSKGRVTLMGDAAHPMRPFMAQGAGQAMEDAAVLARALAFDREALSILDCFELYETNRKPRATWVQSVSRTHDFRTGVFTDESSPSSARWLYSYDAWNDPLVVPKT